jgi:hypothetical protein
VIEGDAVVAALTVPVSARDAVTVAPGATVDDRLPPSLRPAATVAATVVGAFTTPEDDGAGPGTRRIAPGGRPWYRSALWETIRIVGGIAGPLAAAVTVVAAVVDAATAPVSVRAPVTVVAAVTAAEAAAVSVRAAVTDVEAAVLEETFALSDRAAVTVEPAEDTADTVAGEVTFAVTVACAVVVADTEALSLRAAVTVVAGVLLAPTAAATRMVAASELRTMGTFG